MFAIVRLFEGLLFAHAFVLASYALGASILWPRERADSSAAAMLRVVCTSAFGMSAYGLVLFFLALAGLFRVPFLAGAFVALVLAGALLRKESPFTAGYWRVRLADLVQCWDLPFLVAYYCLLAFGMLAVLPDPGSDPVLYHLPYATDWARAGKLVIDPFLRYPFYAANYTLFFAALLAAHGDSFVNFLTWVGAVLTGLGVCASARVFLQTTLGYWWAALASMALMLSVVLSPAFVHWLATSYIDVPIGGFALCSVLCIHLAFIERDRRWLVPFAVTAGFLVGMKAAFLALLPLFALAGLVAARMLRTSLRHALGVLCILCVCAAPWFVRNVILAGDPFPPIGNLALYGDDAFMSKSEWSTIQLDLGTSRSVQAFVTLPVRAFTQPTSHHDFRDYGVTFLIALLFLPMLIVLVEWAFFGRYNPAATISVLVLAGFVAFWFGTSTFLRYGLLLMPLLAVSLAATAAPLLRRGPVQVLAVCMALVCTVPSSGSTEYLKQTYDRYKSLPIYYTDEDAFLRSFEAGYAEEEFTAAVFRKNGLDGRVYTFGGENFGASYYFRRNGLVDAGDWVGPGSFYRLAAAIDTHETLQYFDDLHVEAVEIGTGTVAGLGVPLKEQLLAAGFCELRVPDTQSVLLVRFRGRCRDLAAP
jgi:hypothetical protein